MSRARTSRPARHERARPGATPPGAGSVLALGFALLLPAGTAAQAIEGVALGPTGAPLDGVPVVLHRIGTTGGAMAGTDTTGSAGEFRFVLEAQDSAVYFAAVRYEGSLYIGPAIQAGADPLTEYVLQVSPEAEVGAVGSALSGGGMGGMPQQPAAARPSRATGGSSDVGALWLVSLLALAAAGVFVYTAPRYRERQSREALVEVAGIENRLADESQLSADERARLEERRDRLKEQLAPPA